MTSNIDRDPRAARRLPPSVTGLALVCLAFVLTPDGASPQTPAGPGGYAAGDTVELDELVVTAHRMAIPEDAHAGTVTVLDREDLRETGAEHLAEALRGVAGINVVQAGSWGAVTSVFVRGGESNYLQVLVDGVQVNRPGGDFDFSSLTVDAVERVEIVRGPASVVHGSDAVSGVIQIFTRTGEGTANLQGSLRGGTHGSLDWSGDVSGGNEEIGYSFSLSGFETDGMREQNNDYRNFVANGRVRLRPDARTEADVSVRYVDDAFHFPTDGAGRVVDDNQLTFGDRIVAGARFGRFLTDRLEARLELGVHAFDDGVDDAPDGPADTLGAYGFQSRTDGVRRSVDGRLNAHLGSSTVVTVGAEWEEQGESRRSETLTTAGTSRDSSDLDRGNRGYYAQLLTSPVESLDLSAGARVDDNDAFGTHGTYRAGASWRAGAGPRLRASVGTGFREPTLLENFATGFVSGNPDLDPERSRSWEIGVEQRLLEGRVELSVTAFDQSYRELIQFTFEPPGPEDPNYFNVPGASARGLETGFGAELASGARLSASYTLLDTEVSEAGFDSGPNATFVEGEPLLRRPRHAANATLRVPFKSGVGRLSAHWVGARWDRDFSENPARRVELPSYARLDLSLRHPLELGGPSGVVRRLVPTLRVENLLDADYQEAVNFPARGRTLFVGAEVDVSP